MSKRAPSIRLIDLFAGIGGMTCGFVQARRGFEPVFAVEIEKAAAEIYRANFGDHIHVGDIAAVEEFPKADVVIGGPPCQGFSPLGRDRDPDLGSVERIEAGATAHRDEQGGSAS